MNLIEKYLGEGLTDSYYTTVMIGRTEYEVEYGVDPGERPSNFRGHYHAGYPAEIEILTVKIKKTGRKIGVSDRLENMIIDAIKDGEDY